ncbi:polysaccharide pyruvyl transferase family protein [Halovulum dunhuangense]|uniref:Polysaccharide pyruvyl transferase family protein n=1 Tax=Halovulum dunhuangense TaxID=1505036 RepID=A0A849L146_9RHOB|nr:polysaccharide pyruvyl transferase family protein [Halovulum dunhuangense]NNU80006.1 polysaccharide pyruvyl transferase family protein [Halovulum dunhuangense]
MRVVLLWSMADPGLYSNAPFDRLYAGIGHNNGNLAFVAGASVTLPDIVSILPWHTAPEQINAEADLVVLPCANQLGAHTDLGAMAELLGRIDVPVVALGLGAQTMSRDEDVTLTPGTAAWLDVLIANGRRFGRNNIYTRGPYATEQIRKLTGAEVVTGSCPSQFIELAPGLGRRIESRWQALDLPRSIAVAGGHQAWDKVRVIEQQLVAMMMDPVHPGVYVPQSMGDMIRISRDLLHEVEPDVRERIRRHLMPHYTPELFAAWCNAYARSFYDVPAWMDELRRHDLTIGPRYHGAALAIQAGRMACTITIDSRTEELCRQTDVPHLRAEDMTGPLTRSTLQKLIRFDGAAFDAGRQARAATYLAFLRENGLRPADGLVALAAETEATGAIAAE